MTCLGKARFMEASNSRHQSDTDTNPLLLDVVLNKIFETLAVEDLLQCRKVCKTWMCNTSLKARLKRKTVVHLRTVFLQTGTTKENLPDYFQLSGPIYSRFHFEKITYQNDLIRRFFTVFGSTIRILKLKLDLNQLNIDQFRELIYQRVPNLNELGIYSLSHEEVFLKKLFPASTQAELKHANLQRLEIQEIRTPISQFMTQFLGSLLNLNEIILKVDVCSDWDDQADLWRQNSPLATSVLNGLKNSGKFKDVKVIRGGKLTTKHLNSLLEMGSEGLQLEILELHVPPKSDEDVFNAFLDTQQNSLQQLIIFEQRSARYATRLQLHKHFEVFVLRLPLNMPNLKLLQLSKFSKSALVPMYATDFTRQCPKLKQLILLGYADKPGYNSLYAPTKKCTSLLELTLWNRVIDPNVASILKNSFTNLTKLTVRFPSQEFLVELWTACSKIKDLTLYLAEGLRMDEAISGVPPTNFMSVSKWLVNRMSIDDDTTTEADSQDKESSEEDNDNKSIRNLKDLQSLKLVVDYDEVSHRQAISDYTAYYALQFLARLRRLELYSLHWHAGLTQCQFFSPDCCTSLQNCLNLCVIHFRPNDETCEEARH